MNTFKLHLISAFLLVSFAANSAVFTVSNNPGTPAQYTTVPAAMKVANVGDTLLIHGSNTNYGDIYINKSNLTIIGAGYNPIKDNALSTTLTNIYLDTISLNQTGRGAKIIGLTANYIYAAVNGSAAYSYNLYKMNSVVIDRCNIITTLNICGENCIVRNSYLNSINVNSHGNLMITNNIFATASYGAVTNSNQPSVIVANNDFYEVAVFLGSSSSSSFYNGTFSNNIVFGGQMWYYANSAVKNGITMNNNLTFNLSSLCFGCPNSGGDTLPSAGSFGANNISNQNPLLLNVPAKGPLTYIFDFHLQTNSPAKGKGSDLTDIGITGGSSPWIDNTGTASLPEVKQLNISTVVPLNGSINIQVKAKQHN